MVPAGDPDEWCAPTQLVEGGLDRVEGRDSRGMTAHRVDGKPHEQIDPVVVGSLDTGSDRWRRELENRVGAGVDTLVLECLLERIRLSLGLGVEWRAADRQVIGQKSGRSIRRKLAGPGECRLVPLEVRVLKEDALQKGRDALEGRLCRLAEVDHENSDPQRAASMDLGRAGRGC